jgi:hypothetical protein
MKNAAALPFTLTNVHEVVGTHSGARTTERVHGLLRLEGERVILQWRVAREIQRVGWSAGGEIRTDRETEPVREAEVPLSALAGASVRWLWWRWPPGRYLVLTGADLRAFEQIAGMGGFQMAHPAQLELRVGRSDQLAAREFAGELDLAIADRALRAVEDAPRLAAGAEEDG